MISSNVALTTPLRQNSATTKEFFPQPVLLHQTPRQIPNLSLPHSLHRPQRDIHQYASQLGRLYLLRLLALSNSQSVGQLTFSIQDSLGNKLPIKKLFCRLSINEQCLRNRENISSDTTKCTT